MSNEKNSEGNLVKLDIDLTVLEKFNEVFNNNSNNGVFVTENTNIENLK